VPSSSPPRRPTPFDGENSSAAIRDSARSTSIDRVPRSGEHSRRRDDPPARDPDLAEAAPPRPSTTTPASTPETALLSLSLDLDQFGPGSDEAVVPPAAVVLPLPPLFDGGVMAAEAMVSPPAPLAIDGAADARQASTLSGIGADQADVGASIAHRAESAALRLVDRGLHALLQQRGGTLVMRLAPPELGLLEVLMRFGGDRIEVLFRASSGEASRLLEGNLGMLRQSLERHGVGVGRLAVESPESRRAAESAQSVLGEFFDAGGRESQGRQEAERELRWRTDAGLASPPSTRPLFDLAEAAEGLPTWPSSRPVHPAPPSSPVASAS